MAIQLRSFEWWVQNAWPSQRALPSMPAKKPTMAGIKTISQPVGPEVKYIRFKVYIALKGDVS